MLWYFVNLIAPRRGSYIKGLYWLIRIPLGAAPRRHQLDYLRNLLFITQLLHIAVDGSFADPQHFSGI